MNGFRDLRVGTMLGDRARQLLEKERIALAATEDRARHVGIERLVPDDRFDQSRAVERGERCQRDLRDVRVMHPGRCVAGPVRRRQQDAGGGEAVHKRREKLLRCAIDPMHIFDDDDERPARGGLQEQQAQHVERPRFHRFRAQRVRGGRRVDDADQAQEPGAGVGRQPVVLNGAAD